MLFLEPDIMQININNILRYANKNCTMEENTMFLFLLNKSIANGYFCSIRHPSGIIGQHINLFLLAMVFDAVKLELVLLLLITESNCMLYAVCDE